jgi:hypothetical protein
MTILVSILFTFVYDCLGPDQPNRAQLYSALFVLLELARKCDVFKGSFSVANYQLESQRQIVNYLFTEHFYFVSR